MDGLRSYMVRLGSLELATVIFWMLFWLANGLAKLIPGVHIGVKFAEKGNPFGGALDKMGWGTGLGEFAYYFTGVFGIDRGDHLPVGADPVLHAKRYSGAPSLDPVRIVLERDHLRSVHVPKCGHGVAADTIDLARHVLRQSSECLGLSSLAKASGPT